MASDYGAPSPAPPRTPGTGLDNADLPCAFWDAVPAGTDHPDLLAIEALKEESTPEERAETLKAGWHWGGGWVLGPHAPRRPEAAGADAPSPPPHRPPRPRPTTPSAGVPSCAKSFTSRRA